jgi:hypothetical protein
MVSLVRTGMLLSEPTLVQVSIPASAIISWYIRAVLGGCVRTALTWISAISRHWLSPLAMLLQYRAADIRSVADGRTSRSNSKVSEIYLHLALTPRAASRPVPSRRRSACVHGSVSSLQLSAPVIHIDLSRRRTCRHMLGGLLGCPSCRFSIRGHCCTQRTEELAAACG